MLSYLLIESLKSSKLARYRAVFMVGDLVDLYVKMVVER